MKRNAKDDKPGALGGFKVTRAISVGKVLAVKLQDGTALRVKACHGRNRIFDFHAVGPDVLDSRTAHRTRNPREVLNATPFAFDGIEYKFRPIFSGTDRNVYPSLVFPNDSNGPIDRVEHKALVVFCQNEVRPAAENENREPGNFRAS